MTNYLEKEQVAQWTSKILWALVLWLLSQGVGTLKDLTGTVAELNQKVAVVIEQTSSLFREMDSEKHLREEQEKRIRAVEIEIREYRRHK
mgnify:CR=1 FL=1